MNQTVKAAIAEFLIYLAMFFAGMMLLGLGVEHSCGGLLLVLASHGYYRTYIKEW